VRKKRGVSLPILNVCFSEEKFLQENYHFNKSPTTQSHSQYGTYIKQRSHNYSSNKCDTAAKSKASKHTGSVLAGHVSLHDSFKGHAVPVPHVHTVSSLLNAHTLRAGSWQAKTRWLTATCLLAGAAKDAFLFFFVFQSVS
jgi:hypothetical protein